MARLLPDEPAPAQRYPGLWANGVAYRIDGVLAGHLPLGGVLHLPDGGALSLSANGTPGVSPLASDGLVVALEPLPRLGIDLSALPWSAFGDETVAVELPAHSAWTSTGLSVEAGDVVRVAVSGVLRNVNTPNTGSTADVGPAGLWVRASTEDWLVPGSRALAPHVRLGGHVMAVPPDGVFTAPTGGSLEVAANGCVPDPHGRCAEVLAGATGSFDVGVGVVRSQVASEVD